MPIDAKLAKPTSIKKTPLGSGTAATSDIATGVASSDPRNKSDVVPPTFAAASISVALAAAVKVINTGLPSVMGANTGP
jgi:hypothetical protein